MYKVMTDIVGSYNMEKKWKKEEERYILGFYE